MTPSPIPASPCRICTAHLVALCDQRAWWFPPFRHALTAGVRLCTWLGRVPADPPPPRSPHCLACLRFQKNALKQHSALFRWLDRGVNPWFNRVRNRLLTEAELNQARLLAERRADPDWQADWGADGHHRY